MTKDEALRLALEALEDLGMKHYENTGEVLYKETFTAIKAALEAKDEPVAWMNAHDVGFKKSEFGNTPTIPLYTTPPQRKPLTDEQAMDAYFETPPFGTYKEAFIAGIRFIEAAHGIKEEA
jgi:hypothetical protein